jgi:hypothetical protein
VDPWVTRVVLNQVQVPKADLSVVQKAWVARAREPAVPRAVLKADLWATRVETLAVLKVALRAVLRVVPLKAETRAVAVAPVLATLSVVARVACSSLSGS